MSDSPQFDAPDALAEAIAENPEAVATFVENLDEVNELMTLLALASGALDDEMVVLLADTANQIGTLADTATEPETVRALESILHAVGDATGDLQEPPDQLGMVGLLKAMRDPEVQAGMGFLVSVARNLGRDLNRRSEMRSED